MAVTSLWRIQGSLGNVATYIENPEKTMNPSVISEGCLDDVLHYAMNEAKTTLPQGEASKLDDEGIEKKQQLVSGINCLPGTARFEMMAVKKRFGKEGGTVAYHGYQSFATGEVTPEVAHEIGVKLARNLWGDRYQVLVATHLDKASHIHNHFLINTVSFLDGKKFYRSNKDYYDMRKASDALCREYGLSVVEKPKRSGQSYAQWKAGQEGKPTGRSLVKADVDEAILAALTDKHFFQLLRDKGYEIKLGKDITLRPPGKARGLKLARNFGEDYTLEAIRNRILRHPFLPRPRPQPKQQSRRVKTQPGTWRATRRMTGLRSRYFYWCHKLGIQPKGKTSRKRHYLQREDYFQFQNLIAESWLLTKNRIETSQQLDAYRTRVEEQIQRLNGQRQSLYQQKRTVAVRRDPDSQAALQRDIDALTLELKRLRREVHLCDHIAERSAALQEKIKTVREDEKEGQHHESRERSRKPSGEPSHPNRG